MPLVEKVLLWVQASQRKRLHTGTDSKWPDTVFFFKASQGHTGPGESNEAHTGPVKPRSKSEGTKPTQVQK